MTSTLAFARKIVIDFIDEGIQPNVFINTPFATMSPINGPFMLKDNSTNTECIYFSNNFKQLYCSFKELKQAASWSGIEIISLGKSYELRKTATTHINSMKVVK